MLDKITMMRAQSLGIMVIALAGCSTRTGDDRSQTPLGGDPDAPPPIASVGCVQTQDRADMSVLVNGTLVLGCSGGNRPVPPSTPDGGRRFLVKWEHEGRVGTVDAESFTLNMCDADSDCLDAWATVRIAAADLDLQTVLEPGALVKVHGETDTWVCSGYLVVESLDSWNGMTNPFPAAGGFYVAAFEAAAWAEAPYRIDPVRLPCPFDTTLETCGGTDLQTGLYVFEFKPGHENTPTTLLPMGQTVSVSVPHSPERWRVHNLRSYQTSHCDDYWNWAYWIARER